MIFGDGETLAELIADHNSPRISKIGSIANIFVDKNYEGATSTVISFLLPLIVSIYECFSQSIGHIFPPIRLEEIFMQFLFQEL